MNLGSCCRSGAIDAIQLMRLEILFYVLFYPSARLLAQLYSISWLRSGDGDDCVSREVGTRAAPSLHIQWDLTAENDFWCWEFWK